MTDHKPHDAGSHDQQMTQAVQRVIDEADKRARDKAAMPAACQTPTGCREHGCHGECLPPGANERQDAYRCIAPACKPLGCSGCNCAVPADVYAALGRAFSEAENAKVADLAMMLKTCAWALRRGSAPDLGERALVLLKKHGLLGAPLRDETLDEAGAAAAALYDRWTGKS